jgi:hypothetical protein
MSAKPISRKDFAHFRKIGKHTFLLFRRPANGYALPRKWNPPQGEKHEEDDCQDYFGYVFAARLGRDSGPGRHGTCSGMLALPLLIEVTFVHCEWLV